MTPKMLDLDNLTQQTISVTKKVMEDLELVQEKEPGFRVVTILLTDLILLQATQASLTLAFLERWADETAEPAPDRDEENGCFVCGKVHTGLCEEQPEQP